MSEELFRLLGLAVAAMGVAGLVTTIVVIAADIITDIIEEWRERNSDGGGS